MPIVDMKDMLGHAREHGYAVGAFEVVSLDFLEGIVQAAERARAPLILSLAETHFPYFDFDLLMPAVEEAAMRAQVPVAIHFDHGTSVESAIRGINRGCNGVLVDLSHLDFSENTRRTREVVETAHACGVAVEGELGYVPGVEGEGAETFPGELSHTSLAEAKAYVERTGIDFLAVSIGTVHGRMKGKPRLDYARLKQIRDALDVPLVIHGGSGLSDDQYRRLIANGITKINCYSALADAAANRLRQNLARQKKGSWPGAVNGVREAIAEEVERCMRLWGAAGRAAEVLARCRAWTPVEHLIIYNVDKPDMVDVQAMMEEGRRVLSAIPGVREVITGEAVQTDASYRYTWLVRFCHPRVIDSYREHPAHVAFANQRFRPVAGNRISIDYQT
ncbi:class II fructose-bisphosphate aldolase [Thiohalobacter sp. IOR34]|uniref:class II fructose-bisphosphate aldolase n=1 Tax=Thiohalobacter sp. IOR34 TaxID=3057176 RepID=UPI0025B06593|nr:class II fructose-bisphosphate aldolase [Thiohalobacter sp. IOR34]WJW75858.1 class II fructose-bisphosphate aldolase [Thiohalobacter sp. IOR34]